MNNFDLKNKVAVVTGGAQGFGYSVTERFILSGAKVIIWDIDESECKKAISKIKSDNCIFQIVDVQNVDQIKSNLIEIEKVLASVGATLEIDLFKMPRAALETVDEVW